MNSENIEVRREFVVVCAITLLAAALRLYRIGSVPIHGDEYGSILEAAKLGTSFHSMPYYLILRAWTHLGSSDVMLRLPSAAFGVLAVPIVYLLAKEVLGSRAHGALAALLSATSPFAIEYSQQDRFYAFFLLTASVAFLAFARFLRVHRSRAGLWLLIAADLLCMVSHALGFVVVLVQLACFAGCKMRRRTTIFLACLGFCGVLAAVVKPDWLGFLFRWWDGYVKLHGAGYSGPRGLQVSSLAKIPMALFFYLFGNSVYPLTLWLVLPGLAVFALLAVSGLLAIRKNGSTLWLVVTWITLPLLLLFLVFDAIAPQGYVGADGKYVIHVLTALQLILAAGIMGLGRFRTAAMILCLAVVAGSLAFYYYPSWSYTPRLGDWRAAAQYVESRAGAEAIVLYDGRSSDGVTRYFPATLRRELFWNYLRNGSAEALGNFSQVFVVADDFKNENRQDMNRFLKSLQGRFFNAVSYVEYPLFVLAMRRIDSSQAPAADRAGAVPVPAEIYGMEFQDLALPRTVRFAGRQLRIVGGFAVPDPDGERERAIEGAGGSKATSLILLSSLVDAGAGAPGRPVAELIVQSRNQESRRFLLRQGIETNDWSQTCPYPSGAAPACAVAGSWKHRVALVGRRAYPGAWREFDGHIFRARLEFPGPMAAEEIKVRYLLDRGYLQIWGMEMAE